MPQWPRSVVRDSCNCQVAVGTNSYLNVPGGFQRNGSFGPQGAAVYCGSGVEPSRGSSATRFIETTAESSLHKPRSTPLKTGVCGSSSALKSPKSPSSGLLLRSYILVYTKNEVGNQSSWDPLWASQGLCRPGLGPSGVLRGSFIDQGQLFGIELSCCLG